MRIAQEQFQLAVGQKNEHLPLACVLIPDMGQCRRVKMTRLRARVAERLKGAQNTFAMLTTFNEIDMTNLMALRADYKVGSLCAC